MKHYISLGAGVQSSCMALMAAHGEIGPMPEAAFFADTQAEPDSVYEWLDWLEGQLPFPVIRVSKGSLTNDALTARITKDGRAFSKTSIPLHTLNEDGSKGMITHRSCTVDFKIKPLLKGVKKHAGVKWGQKFVSVTQWIGISLDEVTRMKDSREKWAVNRWPLVELKMKRHDCLRWMEKNGYPEPPRSACVYCPFHHDAEWRRLKNNEPAAFEAAVDFERKIQKLKAQSDNFKSMPFLHASLKPLDEVDFSTDTDKGQLLLWGNECEGMCGI